MPPFCCDCRDFDPAVQLCMRKVVREGTDLVTGKPFQTICYSLDAYIERASEERSGIALCGPSGKFFQPKDVTKTKGGDHGT